MFADYSHALEEFKEPRIPLTVLGSIAGMFVTTLRRVLTDIHLEYELPFIDEDELTVNHLTSRLCLDGFVVNQQDVHEHWKASDETMHEIVLAAVDKCLNEPGVGCHDELVETLSDRSADYSSLERSFHEPELQGLTENIFPAHFVLTVKSLQLALPPIYVLNEDEKLVRAYHRLAFDKALNESH